MKGLRASDSGLRASAVLIALTLSSCDDGQSTIPVEQLAALPEPVTNNAVAVADIDGRPVLFSFLGLGAGKTWADTTAHAYVYQSGNKSWTRIDDVPGPGGRLASTAVAVGSKVYVFGGYTVAEDGSEVSVPDVYALDAYTFIYERREAMPVPVDDAVSFAYQERYIYLVSGWHNSANVNLVQVYDTERDSWFQATAWPGAAVFGHAGGLFDRTIVICDGVRIEVRESERRKFDATDACYRGVIDAADPSRIDWYAMPPHPGTSRYRMAAAGVSRNSGEILFVGGTDNPYNFDGMGYNGVPSEPSAHVFAWSIGSNAWLDYGALDLATMDHRGLIENESRIIIIGGMRAHQAVTDSVIAFSLP